MAIRYKAHSCFIDGKQLTQQQTLDSDATANSEAVITDSEEIGYTAGRPETKLSVKGALPVTGLDVDMDTLLYNQKQFTFAAAIGDKVKTWKGCRLISYKTSGDQTKGTSTFDAEIGAGKPTIT